MKNKELLEDLKNALKQLNTDITFHEGQLKYKGALKEAILEKIKRSEDA